MPILKNARHERFAAALAEGMSQEQAYVAAGFSPKGARGSACRLLQRYARIRKRRDELLAERERLRAGAQVAAAARFEYDTNIALSEAHEALGLARTKKDPRAMVAAVQLKAKLAGVLIERVERRLVDEFGFPRNPEEAEELLQRIRAERARRQGQGKPQLAVVPTPAKAG